MVGAGEAPPVKEVGVGGVRIYEGNGGGDAGVAEEVAAGEVAGGGLVGDGFGGVIVIELWGGRQVALGAE